ncbi:MAG TPA: ElyC/SanA/YdcF family protein [Terriglobia bacterium]|nr:ElyC/SanA/YdcF family protein [Terriglobia bacterium]
MTFFLKKIVSRVLFPLPLSLEFLLLGLFLLWFTRRQRMGKTLVTLGALLLAGLSNSTVSNALLRPLERQYPPFALERNGVSPQSEMYIAVLGGRADDDPNVPDSSRISPDLMARLIEGIVLHREIPGSKLILSGNNDSATSMSKIALTLGVSPDDVLPMATPRDTEEESQQIAPIVRGGQFILVTSASHMPRAMGLFRKRGLQPIPAPADYLAPRHRPEVDDFIPDAYKLFKSQTAFYEYLGLAWGTLRGKI